MRGTDMATRKKKSAPAETITSYKGFDANWQCRGFQFEVGKSYAHKGKVEAREGGFHACEYPLDVFDYYPPAGSKLALVEQSGDLSRHGDDSKVASRNITVKAELTLSAIIQAAIEFTFARATPVNSSHATVEYASATSTGYCGAATSTGTQGAATSTGIR